MHPFKLRLSTLITAVVALALLTVAIDWNARPGVAEAQGIAQPSKPVDTSSAGVMTVNGAPRPALPTATSTAIPPTRDVSLPAASSGATTPFSRIGPVTAR